MKAPRPARWYFDADTIGTGKVLARVRDDVTWPGDDGQRPWSTRLEVTPCPVPRTGVADDIWIPTVTASGMAIITRDRHLMTRLNELAAIRASAARVFTIRADGHQLNRWELLEIVVSRWREMEAVSSAPGPYVYSLTRTGRVQRLDA